MTSRRSGEEPSAATKVIVSPSNRNTRLYSASHNRVALDAIVSNTGCTFVGELDITPRISPVAVCCSSASARRFSRSRTLAPSFLGALRKPLAPVGFAPRRIGDSLPPTGLAHSDRRWAKRRRFYLA